MGTPAIDDAFLHSIRIHPEPRFANRLKMKLDQSSNEWEPSMFARIQASAPISRRSMALFAIAGLHAAFILVLTSGLVQRITGSKPPPIAVEFPELHHQPAPAPHLTDPVLERIAIPVPILPDPIEYTPEASTGSTIDTTPTQYSGTAVEDSSGSYVRAGIGKHFPDPDSFYPPSAVRQEIEGKALVRVCVGPDGKLAEAPQIARSTKNRLLDDAALRLARAGSYVAGSRDGVAITDCFNFQAKFQIARNAR